MLFWNLLYCIILFFNSLNGHQSNRFLYGLTIVADHRRLKVNLGNRRKAWLFWLMLFFEIILYVLAVSFTIIGVRGV